MNALEIRNLSYHYRGHWQRTRVQALFDLSLSVAQGECFGFLGHNGAGKTTAIKCILGLTRPSAGDIRIFEKNARDARSRVGVAYVPEQPYFYDHLTVEETVRLYAVLHGLSTRDAGGAVAAALAKLGIADRARAPLRTLSKGLVQRVAMAQAIVAAPKLLVLDEPFSGLDPLGRKEFRDLLQELKQKGTTIFVSSHILNDIEFLCERVSILSRGVLKGVFRLKDLPQLVSAVYEMIVRAPESARERFAGLAASITPYEGALRLNFSGRENADRALALAVQQGFAIESFQHVHGNLEDLFVKVVAQK